MKESQSCRSVAKESGAAIPLLVILALGALVSPGAAQSSRPNREVYHVEARRIESIPTIDGVLDEEIWQGAAAVEEFTQQEPAEGAPATERTEVRILYDSSRLFIGVHAFDSNPVVATEMRRDSNRILEEDNFQVIFDTFNDLRSGYMFVTNPLGAKLEQQIFEEGEGGGRGTNSNINRNWDGVWDVAARRTSDGWTAEIAIPLKTLRFRARDEQIWGINFMRNIRRKNERVYWAPISTAYSLTRVSLAGTLRGLESLSQGMDLRIKPFVTAGFHTERQEDNGLDTSSLGDVGLDVTYGVTSSLNLDLTVNTDFAQAEVDQQQVNLTRFSLFFPEKREFFLENAGQFLAGTTGSPFRQVDLFFSRRIGLSSAGDPIPIIGGARFTGKQGRNNIALMDIQTAEYFDQPGANFLVSRYSRDILSRSKIGGLFINKQDESGGHYNRTVAADATLVLAENLTVNSFLAKTSTPEVTEGDMAYSGRIAYRDPAWNVYAQYTDIQDNFNAEVGFVPRRGVRITDLLLERTPRPKRYNIRVMNPMFRLLNTTDQDNRLLSRWAHYMLGVRLEDGTFINVFYNRRFERLDGPFFIRPDVDIPAGDYSFGEWNFMFNTDQSRRIYERFTYAPKDFFNGTRTDINAVVGVRATDRFSTELQYVRNDVDLPGGDFVVNLAILGLDYTLSPDATIRSLLQYNSSTKDVSTSVRFNYRYTPGSDIYIAYDELVDTGAGSFLKDRRLVVKLNYLLSR